MSKSVEITFSRISLSTRVVPKVCMIFWSARSFSSGLTTVSIRLLDVAMSMVANTVD